MMQGFKRASARLLIAALLTVSLAQHAAAADDTYPSRPVHVIVPYPGGSGSDVVARLLFDRIGQAVGQQFVIDNRPGAGGIVATKAITSAAPDGYTILFSAAGPLAINVALAKTVPYDPLKDFAHISKVVSVPNILVVNSQLPVKTPQEFVKFAREQTAPLNYSSVGIGSASHLAAAHFATSAGVDMTHIPYRGMSQLVADLVSGEVPVSFSVYSNVAGSIGTGQLRAVAVAAESRLPILPDVPTLVESGLPALDSSAWFAVLAPRDTPPAIVAFLNKAIAAALAEPELKRRLNELGAIVEPSSPEALKSVIASEIEKWRKVSEQTGIRLQ